ncbi:hypothetical protein C8A03DRAFT_29576 [Achaetomium macrosporum]|uniref:Uncharacterized protein n=1 Tax=Achaetomium macrosporum TaxID=79813 RepID=A0AAN7HGW6_9PEZI|nr:hypothetical protein C8A03DRAFT_29576 [Achaetomium macrosporum]
MAFNELPLGTAPTDNQAAHSSADAGSMASNAPGTAQVMNTAPQTGDAAAASRGSGIDRARKGRRGEEYGVPGNQATGPTPVDKNKLMDDMFGPAPHRTSAGPPPVDKNKFQVNG